MSKVDRVVAIRDGKTSTETIRRVAIDMADFAAGNIVLGETHDEFVVLDGAGRLQIPREYLDKLSIKKKVRLDLEGDQIIIRAIDVDDEAEEEAKRSNERSQRRWGFR
jgi:hypothetical protein